MDIQDTFSKLLNSLLLKSGLNDKQIIGHLGISRFTLNRWRYDGNRPNSKHMKAICDNFSDLVSEEEWNNIVEAGGYVFGAFPHHQTQIDARATDLLSRINFEGRAKVLNPSVFYQKASLSEVADFYAGAPLTWRIISSDAEIRREQESDILQHLEETHEGFCMACIVGEFGAGKSTLAWRIARELCERKNITVVHLIDNSEPGFWFNLSQFVDRLRHRLYILVDDVFRDERVVQAIKLIDIDLPVTVIATSRSEEYRGERRLGKPIIKIDLRTLSPREKHEFVRCFGIPYQDLTPVQKSLIEKANTPLILGMELAESKDFKEIIRDAVQRLKEIDDSIYRAYEYVCFAYQYGIKVPIELLEALDDTGRFYDLPERDSAKGILFEDTSDTIYVKARAESVAKFAFSLYQRDPAQVLREYIRSVNMNDRISRIFISRLVNRFSHDKKAACRRVLIELNSLLQQMLAISEVSDLARWVSTYTTLGLEEEARRCSDEILTRVPRLKTDCHVIASESVRRSMIPLAIPMLDNWVVRNPGDASIRAVYLQMSAKLKRHESSSVLIEETSEWLSQHPEDTDVRSSFLDLVAKLGKAEEFDRVISSLENWLDSYPDHHQMRKKYLAIMKKKGTLQQKKHALIETAAWLPHLAKHKFVLSAFTALMTKTTRELLESRIKLPAKARLKADHLHPRGIKAIEHFSNMLFELGVYDDANKLYESLLIASPYSGSIRYGYAKVLMVFNHFEKARNELNKAVEFGYENEFVHALIAICSLKMGSDKKAENELRTVFRLLKQSRNWINLFNIASLTETYNCLPLKLKCLEKLAQEYPFAWNYILLGWAYFQSDQPHDALKAFNKSLEVQIPYSADEPHIKPILSAIGKCKQKIDKEYKEG
ncbi:tetratricopeptide repeat protein [Chloroflexota bacterium]